MLAQPAHGEWIAVPNWRLCFASFSPFTGCVGLRTLGKRLAIRRGLSPIYLQLEIELECAACAPSAAHAML